MISEKVLPPRFVDPVPIASGTRFQVFRARDEERGLRVAVKRMRRPPESLEERLRFENEFSALSAFDHPNVVRVLDTGVAADGSPWYSMDLVDGNPLSALARRGDWIGFARAAFGGARGLAAVHARGILHLALEPSSLVVLGEGKKARAVLTGFGLAEARPDVEDRLARGTIGYLAPEILRDAPFDRRADLYALGAVLYASATGGLPVDGAPSGDAIRFALQGEFVPPSRIRPDLPAPLEAVILRLLRRQVSERFASADEVARLLAPMAGEKPDPATVESSVLLAPALVGRDGVAGTFEDLIQAARVGRGGAFGLLGEEGAGKSRLIRELAFRAEMAGALVLHGRSAGHQRTPYRPFAEILGALLRRADGAPPAALVQVVGWLSGEGPDRAFGDEEASRFALYEAVAGALAEGTGRRLSVFFVDDLHEADRATLELFAHLVRVLDDLPLILVAAFRPAAEGWGGDGEARPLEPAELFREQGIATIPLGALDDDGMRQLVTSILGAAAEPSLPGWLARESGGNPGMAIRLLPELVDAGLLARRAGGWAVETPSLSAFRVPPGSSSELFRRRAEALPTSASRLLAVAALLGEPFTFDRAVKVAGLAGADGLEAFDLLVREGFLVSLPPSVVAGGRHGFASESFRQMVASGVDPDRRRDLHEAAARAMEETPPRVGEDRLGPLAYHYGRGRDHDQGARHGLACAERAERLAAFEAAADAYRVTLDLLDLSGDEARRAEVRERLADLHARDGKIRAALSSYHFLVEAFGRRGGDDATARRNVARVTLKIGRIAARRGDAATAAARAREAVALVDGLDLPRDEEASFVVELAAALASAGDLEGASAAAARAEALLPAGDSRLRIELAATRGLVAFVRGELSEAVALLHEAEPMAERLGAADLVRRTAHDLARVLARRGERDAAVAMERRALEAAERSVDPRREAESLQALAEFERERDRWADAVGLLERAIRLERRLGDRSGEALARLRLAEVFDVVGRWSEARSQAREVLDRVPDPTGRLASEARLVLASLARKRGDLEEALRLARETATAAEAAADPVLLSRAVHELARIDQDTEDWEGALGQLDRALTLLEESGRGEDAAPILVSLADLSVRRGETVEAEGWLDRAAALAERAGDGLAGARVLVTRGRIEHARGRRDEAERLFAAGVKKFEEIGAAWDLGRACSAWGVRIDDDTRALELLEQSALLLGGLGASLELERVRGAASRIREKAREAGEGAEIGGGGGAGVIGLYEVAKVINSTLDLDEVLVRVLDLARARLEAERGLLVLLDPITSEPRTRVVRSVRPGPEPESRTKFGDDVIAEVLRTGRSILSADVRDDRRFAQVSGIGDAGIVSLLAVPVLAKERISGAILVDHGGHRNLFDTKDLAFLEAFADQAAIAIENARLYGELVQVRSRLTAENETLRQEVLSDKHLEQMVGRGENVAKIQYAIRRAAASNATVLIRGESGTGKGLVARLIHAVGPRATGPFIKFNAAALPETLAESELFGHEKGSFTGADRRKLGRFELARGGTIFLDEIGKISLGVQSKLLRVVEDKEFERVGGTETIRVDCKILAATNLEIESAIARNEFREDLFYRLNIIPIHLPPLRERREDIPLLAEHFVRKICGDMGQDPKRFGAGVLDLFRAYGWPGNIRELEGAIHRAIVMSSRDELVPEDFVWMGISAGPELPPELPGSDILHPAYRKVKLEAGLYEELIARVDRELIERALSENGGKIRETARKLGLARNTLRSKMRKYGLSADGGDAGDDAEG